MELKAEKMKVVLIDKETGERRQLPGVIGISHVDVGEFLPKPNHKTGLYSWQAKVTCRTHIGRKMRKDIRRIFGTRRPPKYINKATYVSWIMRYDVTNFKTQDQLMRLSHRELEKTIALLAPIIVSGERERACRMVPEHKTDFPCGGIVPNPQVEFNVNTNEAVMSIEKCMQMLEEFKAQS